MKSKFTRSVRTQSAIAQKLKTFVAFMVLASAFAARADDQIVSHQNAAEPSKRAENPIIHADVPDTAKFFYSLDGKSWAVIGEPLKMTYTLPHFMGYRFGLFNFATKTPGGYGDFDFFHASDKITAQIGQESGRTSY